MPTPASLEPTYADRTDSVDTKIEILRHALKTGHHELALGVVDSIKDTVGNERMLTAEPDSVDLPSGGWRPVAELPASWSSWADGWGLFQMVQLRETAGQPRRSEPVDLVVACPVTRVVSPTRELRVARLEEGRPQEIRSQVYGELRRGPDRFVHIVFEADVPATGESHFLVLCANPAAELPDYTSGMRVSGEGVGLEIETPDYLATLSPQMGQLESLTPRWHKGGLKLSTHGNGHGEPPNLDWAHDYMSAGPFQKMRMTNWAACPNAEVIRGPVCTIVRRFGFPHSPVHPLFTPSRLFMDLSYTFYAGVPYFMKEGTMEATQDFQVHVARDDEWYFSGQVFNECLWMDRRGGVHEGQVPPDQMDHVWGAGFYHRETRDSLFAIYLTHELDASRSPNADPPPLYQHMDLTVAHAKPGEPPHASVLCRPMLRDNARLQPGMRLLQRNAYLLAPYTEDGAAQLEALRERLQHPLVAVAGSTDLPAGRDLPPDTRPLARTGERAADWPAKRVLWDAMAEVLEDQMSLAGANVVDMGYIYDVRRLGDEVHVIMTMPHRGRPKYNFLAQPLRRRLEQVSGVRSVVVDLSWDPAWTPNRLTDEGRRMMGLPDA